MTRLRRIVVLSLLLIVNGAAAAESSEPAELERARLKVSGMGWLENRRLKQLLRKADAPAGFQSYFESGMVEDGAVLLLADLEEKGFPEASIGVRMTLTDGSRFEQSVSGKDLLELPNGWRVREVRYRIEHGRRVYFGDIEFDGLESIGKGAARRFFRPGDALVILRGARPFSQARLERGVRALTAALRGEGREEARVEIERIERPGDTGEVRLWLRVEEGPRSVVRSVKAAVKSGEGTESLPVSPKLRSQPYSELWRQDLVRLLEADQGEEGHLEASVSLEVERDPGESGDIEVDIRATVEPGQVFRVGQLRFEGLTRGRTGFLERRVRLRSGEVLNRTEAGAGRQRLSRLGIFDSVGMRIVPTSDEGVRDVVYELDESKRFEVSLLAGFGSYDLLRGGVDLEWRNALGVAHQFRARGVQSFKSTSGDALYSIPARLGEEVTVFFNGAALRREEVSFIRQEYGGGAGVRRFFPAISSDLGLRYSYEFLNAVDAPTVPGPQPERSESAAMIVEFHHDLRDNPLNPQRGLKLLVSGEFAAQEFGGEVDYQRIELAGSIHVRLGGGRFLHLGASHGALVQALDQSTILPFNKRFFPGGENSIRGYQRGEAAPRNADGQIVGAETFLLGTLELEQALTPSWSVVGFADAITFAQGIDDYPGDETLVSVGGGIRWKTVIGPARLEYGYNLNRREGDPMGTLQFSLGFPF